MVRGRLTFMWCSACRRNRQYQLVRQRQAVGQTLKWALITIGEAAVAQQQGESAAQSDVFRRTGSRASTKTPKAC